MGITENTGDTELGVKDWDTGCSSVWTHKQKQNSNRTTN